MPYEMCGFFGESLPQAALTLGGKVRPDLQDISYGIFPPPQ
jgi:hypothetical protein